jgi:SNF2 family DNA or RNA helicase
MVRGPRIYGDAKAGMIEHHNKKDWFIIDQESIRPIAEVPGIAYRDMFHGAPRFEVHRSHLPLIETDEAARARIPFWKEGVTWEARDKLTEPLGFKLKVTQHQAVDFIRRRRGTLLGDEMRVGKTLAAAYSHEPELGRLVVIAPLNVREVWLGWLRKIWPNEEIGIMVGKKFEPEAARKRIVFGHYDVLFGWQSGDRIGTLILDEAHCLMNRNSLRSRAAIMLASCAERVVACTGTPIWNMPTGLWNVLALVAPGAFGGYHEFCRRYAAPEPTAYGNVYTGISNGEELSARLTEVMLRRRWVDVQKDLPPITRNTIIVDLTDAQRRKLDITAESLRESDRTNTAASLARYRQALSHIKIPATIEEAGNCMRLGESCVIWAWHRSTVDKIVENLRAEGFVAMAMTGDTPQKHREEVLNQWRSLPSAALVVTMAVAQVGIDLSHSHRPIFAEIDYIPAMVAQAEMRTYAPTRAMNVTYVVADHYVDRKLGMALSHKLDAAEPVNLGTGEGAIAAIDRAFRGPIEEPDLERFLSDLLNS